jgi:hypothetical protein
LFAFTNDHHASFKSLLKRKSTQTLNAACDAKAVPRPLSEKLRPGESGVFKQMMELAVELSGGLQAKNPKRLLTPV